MTASPPQNPAAPSRREGACSVVIPCFNEEEVLAETHRRVTAALDGLPAAGVEFVYVDDGSRDRTLARLVALQQTDARVRVVALSRNFGHQLAVSAGLEHASGDAVVILDADLQDPPEVIPEMFERWRQGADVAYGVRTERAGETAFKRWTASAFYRALGRLADVAIPLDVGDFRLLDRAVADALLAMPERDRFVRGMVAWTGFRQEAVPYRREARAAGETGYPLRKMLRLALDGLLSFSLAPLRLATLVGVAAAGLALAGGAAALALLLFAGIPVGLAAFGLLAALFLGGVQLVVLGILGEYVGRIYGEVKRRPLYLVRERWGFGDLPEYAAARDRAASADPASRGSR